jgi:cytochrome c peroxidase
MNKKFFFDGRQTSIEDAVADALKGEQHFNYIYSKSKLESQPRYSSLFKKAFGRPGDITEDKVNKAIAQFIRTLVSFNSKFDLFMRGEATLTSNEQQGFAIFNDNDSGDCFHCHADGPYLTFANQILFFANNALDSVNSVNDFKDKGLGAISLDANDNGRFKIPTLRNIMLTPPYMHDGRFATIQDVIGHYSDGLKYSPNVDPLMQKFFQGGVRINQIEKDHLIDFLKTLTDTSFVNKPEFQNPFK